MLRVCTMDIIELFSGYLYVNAEHVETQPTTCTSVLNDSVCVTGMSVIAYMFTVDEALTFVKLDGE